MFLLAGWNLDASGESRAAAANPRSVIYLVPTSPATAERLPELQRYFHDALHLDLQVLPIFTPGPSGWNGVRRQRSADDLVQQLIEREETRLRDGRAVVIAITEEDLYTGESEWVFGRWTPARVAVVSYARMDPQSFGLEADPALLSTRLQRIVTRYIGKLYFDLPWSSDATSLLYSDLRSISGIDKLSNDLAADGFFSARPLVEEWSPSTQERDTTNTRKPTSGWRTRRQSSSNASIDRRWTWPGLSGFAPVIRTAASWSGIRRRRGSRRSSRMAGLVHIAG